MVMIKGRSDIPIQHKFGYEHMVEMQQIEDEHRVAGLSGMELFFASIRTYEGRHKSDPTFKQKQQAARARGEDWIGTPSIPSTTDLLRQALEEIRDGHNDPRALARAVLGSLPLRIS